MIIEVIFYLFICLLEVGCEFCFVVGYFVYIQVDGVVIILNIVVYYGVLQSNEKFFFGSDILFLLEFIGQIW